MGRVKDLLPDDWDGYDGYDCEPDCDHGEYDVDWEGRATCAYCRESWWLTPEQHDAYLEAEARWHEEYDRRMRLENSWWYRAWCWLRSLNPWRHTGYPYGPRSATDDEIPF